MSDSSQEAKRRVLSAIDQSRDQLVLFLSEYIRFKSINPEMLHDESVSELRACQEWLANQLISWSTFDEVRLVSVDEEQPNVVARINGRGSGPDLLFNGHSDVVPVTVAQENEWTVGTPWGGEVLANKLAGRGTSDMKGGNAAFLWALKSLAENNILLQGDLLATVVSGEETGNHRIGVDSLAPAGYRAPFAILAESTELKIAPASVGEFYFLIHVDGVSTSLSNRHLSIYPGQFDVPVSGVNAIDKMWKIQAALVALEREWGIWQRHPLMEPGNMNINFSRINGGETYSGMADSCKLTGSVLFNPSLSYQQVLDEFRQTIDGVARSDYWMRQHPPTITAPYILDQKEPVNVSPDHPGTQALASAFQQVVHNEPALTCTTATSDGNYLFANGQTVVTFGPGSPDAGVHGTNETINLDNLITATKIYALAAINYCGFNSIQ